MTLTTVIIIILLTFSSGFARPISEYNASYTPNGIGFAFTGAGGRIGQLTALAQTLINGSFPGGAPVLPSYIAGVSAGALTAVAINGILENMQQNLNNGFTFDHFRDLLFSTTDSDIYTEGNDIDLLEDLDKGYLLNSDPLGTYISGVLSQLNYSVLGDIYLPTYITVVDQRSGLNLRLLSTDPLYSGLSLVQVLQATTAIPLAFQPRQIPQLSVFTQFIDGGTGIDYVPVIPLLSFPGIETIYVITYNNAFNYGVSPNAESDSDLALLRYAEAAYDISGANIAIGDLAILSVANVTGYVYQPTFVTMYATTDFNSMEQQYDSALAWSQNNAPSNVDMDSLLNVTATLPDYTSATTYSDSSIAATGTEYEETAPTAVPSSAVSSVSFTLVYGIVSLLLSL